MKSNVTALLEQRGVTLIDIALLAHELQLKYNPKLTVEECLHNVVCVLEKRDVQHIVLTAVALDILAERHLLPEPLQDIVSHDAALFGVDETLALGIANVYGAIGSTSFGYLDKTKPGILSCLDTSTEHVHTFLDDVVAALAAAVSARVAHRPLE